MMLRRLTTGRAAMLGLVFSAFYYFFMFDEGLAQKSTLANTRARMEELRGQIQDSQRKLDAAAVYKRTAAEVGTTINRLIKLIPEQFGMSDVMRIVSNEVKSAGSSLVSITPEKTEVSAVASEFEELSVKVNLEGSFLQHMVFLSNLTKINQILIVREFEFSHLRDGKGDEAPVVKLVANIVAYRYRSKSAEAGSGAPQ